MDIRSDEFREEVEDSKWLNDEVSTLVNKLSDVISAQAFPSVGEPGSSVEEEESGEQKAEAKVRFGAQISGTQRRPARVHLLAAICARHANY